MGNSICYPKETTKKILCADGQYLDKKLVKKIIILGTQDILVEILAFIVIIVVKYMTL